MAGEWQEGKEKEAGVKGQRVERGSLPPTPSPITNRLRFHVSNCRVNHVARRADCMHDECHRFQVLPRHHMACIIRTAPVSSSAMSG